MSPSTPKAVSTGSRFLPRLRTGKSSSTAVPPRPGWPCMLLPQEGAAGDMATRPVRSKRFWRSWVIRFARDSRLSPSATRQVTGHEGRRRRKKTTRGDLGCQPPHGHFPLMYSMTVSRRFEMVVQPRRGTGYCRGDHYARYAGQLAGEVLHSPSRRSLLASAAVLSTPVIRPSRDAPLLPLDQFRQHGADDLQGRPQVLLNDSDQAFASHSQPGLCDHCRRWRPRDECNSIAPSLRQEAGRRCRRLRGRRKAHALARTRCMPPRLLQGAGRDGDDRAAPLARAPSDLAMPRDEPATSTT